MWAAQHERIEEKRVQSKSSSSSVYGFQSPLPVLFVSVIQINFPLNQGLVNIITWDGYHDVRPSTLIVTDSSLCDVVTVMI